MSDEIDYYFTSLSPFAYLGHNTLMEIAGRYGKKVNFKPFNLFGVWEVSGAVPPGQRSETRQRYRITELKRVALFRDLPLNIKPAHFPTDPTLADHCICMVADAGDDASKLAFEIGRAVWERDQQIADEAVVRGILNETGHDGDGIIAKANSEAASALREANTRAAIAADAIGAPAYVYEGEVFWGQDRLEYLDHMILTGRTSFVAKQATKV